MITEVKLTVDVEEYILVGASNERLNMFDD